MRKVIFQSPDACPKVGPYVPFDEFVKMYNDNPNRIYNADPSAEMHGEQWYSMGVSELSHIVPGAWLIFLPEEEQ